MAGDRLVKDQMLCTSRIICKAAEFFGHDSHEANVLTRTLWLLREACRGGMAFEIRLITLCSLLEGLIHRLENQVISGEDKKSLTRVEKWQAIVAGMGLPWNEVYALVFESWDFYRHPLAHGFQQREDDNPQVTFQAYSGITAAIYILMAKQMGFRGGWISQCWRIWQAFL